jgi:hypothetical protein
MVDRVSVDSDTSTRAWETDGAISGSAIKNTVKIGNVLKPIALSAILGSSTALVVFGCIALATSAAFPPTAFIAFGFMATGVLFLGIANKMREEKAVIETTAYESLGSAALVPMGPVIAIGLVVLCVQNWCSKK